MSQLRVAAYAVLSTALLWSASALADPIGSRYSISLRVGGTSAALDDFHAFFEDFNRDSGILAHSMEEYGSFGDGLSLGGDVRYGVGEQVAIGLKLGFFGGETSVSQDWKVLVGDVDNEGFADDADLIDVSLDRTVKLEVVPITVSGYFYYPMADAINLYVGGGVGIYNVRLSSESVHTLDPFYRGSTEFGLDPFESGIRTWTGSDAGFHVTVGGEYFVTHHLVVTGEALYRSANVREVLDPLNEPFRHLRLLEDGEEPTGGASYQFVQPDNTVHVLTTGGEPPVEFDLSGIDISLGIRWYF